MKTIKEVSDETQDALIRHIRDNTAEDDERREAERDERVKATLKALEQEGKRPPRRQKEQAIPAPVAASAAATPAALQPPATPARRRFGPAPGPLICALVIVVIAVFGRTVRIGFQGTTLSTDETLAMIAGAMLLAAWAIAVAVSASRLRREQGDAAILVQPFSSIRGYDILFSAPFVFAVPAACLTVPALLHGEQPDPELHGAAFFGALIWLGLLAIRERDITAWVREGRVRLRAGWLWVRREELPLERVRAVVVERDTYQGAPSYFVRLDFDDAASCPRLAAIQARFGDSVDKADAEARRWRLVLGLDN